MVHGLSSGLTAWIGQRPRNIGALPSSDIASVMGTCEAGAKWAPKAVYVSGVRCLREETRPERSPAADAGDRCAFGFWGAVPSSHSRGAELVLVEAVAKEGATKRTCDHSREHGADMVRGST